MKLYVMDAFANRIFGGNQAGVALPDRERLMRPCADRCEMKHSETAFIHMEPDGSVSLRYFTPAGRWTCAATPRWPPLPCCGSWRRSATATILPTQKAGELEHHRQGRYCLMDMAPPLQLIGDILAAERAALYAAYGLTEVGLPGGIYPTDGVHRPGGHYDARPGP